MLIVFIYGLNFPFKMLFTEHLGEKTPTFFKKYEHGHLGNWYIKSAIYKRFLN